MKKRLNFFALVAFVALVFSAVTFTSCKEPNEPITSIAGQYKLTWITMSIPTESGEKVHFNTLDVSTISDADLAKLGMTREELQQQVGMFASLYASYELYLGEDNTFWVGMGEDRADAKGTYEFNNKTFKVLFNGSNEKWPNNVSYEAKTKKVIVEGDDIESHFEFQLKE